MRPLEIDTTMLLVKNEKLKLSCNVLCREDPEFKHWVCLAPKSILKLLAVLICQVTKLGEMQFLLLTHVSALTEVDLVTQIFSLIVKPCGDVSVKVNKE